MTPEERVAKISYYFPADHTGEEGDKVIADAIREAISDEREACAKLCDERVDLLERANDGYGGDDFRYQIRELRRIADTIRGRK